MNAIFALAARHLSLTANYDSFASNRYHQECLKHLIPMLDDTTTVSDDSLFAATIILRVLEEMEGMYGKKSSEYIFYRETKTASNHRNRSTRPYARYSDVC